MHLILTEDLPIGKLLDFVSDDSIFVASFSGVLTGSLSLYTFLLCAESFLVSTLMLHLIHKQFVVIDLLINLVGIAVRVIFGGLQVLLELVTIFNVLSS